MSDTADQQLPLRGRWYVGVVSAAGLTILAVALSYLATGLIDIRWLALAGLTLLSASVTVKVPTVPARISVSETFVFTALLVFGPWAGALTVAIDGLVASLWIHGRRKHRLYRTLFNVTAPALALWISAELCLGLAHVPPVIERSTPIEVLLPPLFLLATLYFVLNSGLMAVAISIEKRVSPLSVWRANFLWLAINYFGGASVSVLLILLFNAPVVRSAALGIIIPLLTFFYLTFKIAMDRAEETITHLTEQHRAAEARARLETQLRDAQRMESVGRFAAGLAADFDQVLTPIAGQVKQLLQTMPSGTAQQAALTQLQEEAERARVLTRQLMAVGRKQTLALQPVDLRALLSDFGELLRRTMRNDVRISMEMPNLVRPVRADATQIEQALMNLAVNAEDAMPKGGEISITLSEAVVNDAAAAAQLGLTPGAYAVVSVKDTGRGMDQEAINRAFEPYFVTRERRPGMGLGLSTVYGIVKQHNGHLAIESAPDLGSTFTIFLPLAAA